MSGEPIARDSSSSSEPLTTSRANGLTPPSGKEARLRFCLPGEPVVKALACWKRSGPLPFLPAAAAELVAGGGGGACPRYADLASMSLAIRVVLEESPVATAPDPDGCLRSEPCAALLTMPSLTLTSMSSLISGEMPHRTCDVKFSFTERRSYLVLVTILARVWLPMNWPERVLQPSTRRMSM